MGKNLNPSIFFVAHPGFLSTLEIWRGVEKFQKAPKVPKTPIFDFQTTKKGFKTGRNSPGATTRGQGNRNLGKKQGPLLHSFSKHGRILA